MFTHECRYFHTWMSVCKDVFLSSSFCEAAFLGVMKTLDSLLSDVNLCDTVTKRSVCVFVYGVGGGA